MSQPNTSGGPTNQEVQNAVPDAVQPTELRQATAPTYANNFNSQQQAVNIFGYNPHWAYPPPHAVAYARAASPHTPAPRQGVANAPTPAAAAPAMAAPPVAPPEEVAPTMAAAAAAAPAAAAPAAAPAADAASVRPPPKKKARRTQGQGRGGGRSNQYSKREIQVLLTAVEKYLPIGNPAWKAVEDYYNEHRPEKRPERDLDSLRKKYKELHLKKPPTGDPNIPEEVLEAKRIEEKIIEASQSFVASNLDTTNEEIVVDDNEDTNSKAAKSNTGRSRNSKKKEKVSEEMNFLEYMMEHDLRESQKDREREEREMKRERARERRQAKRERARERRDNKKSNKSMKMWAGLFGMAMNTWVTKKIDEVDVAAIGKMMESSSSSDSSSDESLSSISSSDSPPYKRKKQRALRKKARKST